MPYRATLPPPPTLPHSPCPHPPQVWVLRFAQLPPQLQSAVLGAVGKGDIQPVARRAHLRLVCHQWRERVDACVLKLALDGRRLQPPACCATALQRLISGMPTLTSLSIQQLHLVEDLIGAAPVPGSIAAACLFLPPSTLTQLRSLVLGLPVLDEAQFGALGLADLSQLQNLAHLSIVQDDPKAVTSAQSLRCGGLTAGRNAGLLRTHA